MDLNEFSPPVRLTQDTAGSERYEAMSRIYYRGARAALVCYGKYTLILIIHPNS